MDALQFLESPKKTQAVPPAVLLGCHPRNIEAPALSPLDLLQKRLPLSPLAKRWQFLTLSTPELILGMGFVHLGYITQFFLHFSPTHGKTFETLELALPELQFQMNSRTLAGLEVRYRNPLSHREFQICEDQGILHIQGHDPKSQFQIDARVGIRQAPALTVLGEAVPTLWSSTVKTAALPLDGQIQLGKKQWALSGGQAGLDCTVGYLPRHTQWHWAFAQGIASLSGQSELIGLNFARGNNLGGMNENALWWRGHLISLPPVRMTPGKKQTPWTVKSEEGALLRVDLTFQERSRLFNQNDLKLVRSELVQAYGSFSGQIHLPEGILTLEQVPGICEDQDVLW